MLCVGGCGTVLNSFILYLVLLFLANLPNVAGAGVRIIPAARLGGIGVVRSADGDQDHNAMDLAYLAMFETAKESIKISQQDMGSIVFRGVAPYAWSWEYTDALNRAILRGVHVYVTLSTISTQTYAYGFTLQDVSDKFVESFKRVSSSNDNTKWKAAYCKYFHLGYIRTVAGEDRYKPFKAVKTDRENRIGNHAKLIAVDDSIFYIGSQNFYEAGLAEFGQFAFQQSVSRSGSRKTYGVFYFIFIYSLYFRTCRWLFHRPDCGR